MVDGGRGRSRGTGVEIDVAHEVEAQDDDALLVMASVGDRHAFVELYRRHEALCWAVARTATNSSDTAAAAVADAFVRLLGTPAPPTSASVRSFLATLVQREVDGRRARTRSRSTEPGDDDLLDLTHDHEGIGVDDLPHPDDGPDMHSIGSVGQEIVVEPPNQGDDGDDILWRSLRTVVPPPPPELWALVQVAWDDKRREQTDSNHP